MRDLSGAQNIPYGIDGCSVPAFVLPLVNAARMFAHLAAPDSAPSKYQPGLQTTYTSMRAHPDMVSGVDGMDTVLMSMLPDFASKSGADGYLNKESAPEFLLAAIRRLAAGGKYISAELAEKFARSLGGAAAPPHETLSPREFAIMRGIASGKSLVAIAEAFHVSPKTITSHRAHILDKLGLANNAELTRYALEKGLLDRH